jgi:hypothetical protein
MKKITLLVAIMTTSLGFSQTYLPFTFANANQLMTGVDGTTTSLVADPSNAANQVMQMVGGVLTWDHAFFTLSPAVNLSDNANNTITFRINPIGITGTRQHLLKFEGAGAAEFFFTTTDSGWQTITADYPAGLGVFPKMVIFTDSGAVGNGYVNTDTGTYLIDDIAGATNNPLVGGVTLPFTFSDPNQLLIGADGTTTSLTTDPLNAANPVMQMVGATGTWDHAKLTLNPTVDLSNDAANTITLRMNPIGITGTRTHLLKFEQGTGPNAEFWFTTTDSGWQTISANYPAGLGSYPVMVLFTDAGAPTNGYANGETGTYLVDDIQFAGALSTAKFETSSVKMYPNPVRNTLTIDANSSIQKVSVYNILGQEVMTASPKSNSATLQTSALQKGAYMVRTEIDGSTSTNKIIKE